MSTPRRVISSRPAGARAAGPLRAVAASRASSGLPGVALLAAVLAGAVGAQAVPVPELRSAGSEAPWMAIIQPGYPGSTQDAEGHVRRLTSYLGAKARLPGLTGAYYNVPAAAAAALDERPASFGIVSLGFFLENRDSRGLIPALEVLPEAPFYLLGRSGAAPDEAGSLAGAEVTGGPLHEAEFLRRVVFRDLPGVGEWKAVPALRVTRALRRLEQGAHRAAVVSGGDYEALEKLGRLEGLRVLRRSERYPTALVVAFGAPRVESATDGGDGSGTDVKAKANAARELAVRLAAVFLEMARDREGKEILDTLGCGGFRPVRVEWLEKLERTYDARDEEAKK